jgi:hypothetical protein
MFVALVKKKTVQVTVFNAAPDETPNITANNRQLYASAPFVPEKVSGYQWYRDAIAITGATASSYDAISDGTYSVAYTNWCGPGPISEAIKIYTNIHKLLLSHL